MYVSSAVHIGFILSLLLFYLQITVWLDLNMSVHNLAYQTGQGLRYNGKELLPRRINNQNLVYRLFHRQTHVSSPGTHFHQVRSLYTNVFPNYTVVNVEKPPCFLRKFSPDGKYFIAFSSDQTSLEIYTFQVTSLCEAGSKSGQVDDNTCYLY